MKAWLGQKNLLPRWLTVWLEVRAGGRSLSFMPHRSCHGVAQVPSWHIGWLLSEWGTQGKATWDPYLLWLVSEVIHDFYRILLTTRPSLMPYDRELHRQSRIPTRGEGPLEVSWRPATHLSLKPAMVTLTLDELVAQKDGMFFMPVRSLSPSCLNFPPAFSSVQFSHSVVSPALLRYNWPRKIVYIWGVQHDDLIYLLDIYIVKLPQSG